MYELIVIKYNNNIIKNVNPRMYVWPMKKKYGEAEKLSGFITVTTKLDRYIL